MDDKKRRRLNAFFHRGICQTLSEVTGYTEEEAKEVLQKKFALVSEDHDGYEVESIAGMDLERLNRFVDQCRVFLVTEFGAIANDKLEYHLTKRIEK